MRSLAGGLIGGMIGGLLFSSLGYGSMGTAGGFGVGIFDIVLIGLVLFLLFRLLMPKKAPEPVYYGGGGQKEYAPDDYAPVPVQRDGLAGLADIRRLDPSFDEKRFADAATDIFFKVQSAWKTREMEPVSGLLAPEILEYMRQEVSRMKREGRVNNLENIAMREVSITEAWQESGLDYITAKITANVLDYVTDESGKVMEGSRTEPVKFVEYWTFARDIGKSGWRLSAIQQENG